MSLDGGSSASMQCPRAHDEILDYLARQIEDRAPPAAFALAVAPLRADAALVRPVLDAYVALCAGGDDAAPALGWTRDAADGDPLGFAAAVAAAAALADADAPRAAARLAGMAREPAALDAPRTDPAFACAALALGAHEVLGRAAALDAAAARHPRVDADEAALGRYMDTVAFTSSSALTADHWRALGMLCVPRGADMLQSALAATADAFFEYHVPIPVQPHDLLAAVVGADAAVLRHPFAAWRARGDAPAGWRAVLAAQMPAAHAALSLVGADERRFTRSVVRLIGDAPWPVGAPAARPTLVLLGARAYVLDGAAVAAYGGPGTALAAWRRALRAALRLDEPDLLSAYFSDAPGALP